MNLCLLDSPSSSTSALHTQDISPRRVIPTRAISQQFDDIHRPSHPNGRRSSTRRAIRRLSRLFHRVRNSFIARIPLWSPVGSPAPDSVPSSAPGVLPKTSVDDKERLLNDSETKVVPTFDLHPKINNEVKMIQYSKSFRSIRTRTESLYDRARRKLTSSFRGDRKSKTNVDQFLISEDFHADGQPDCISVARGERVELLDQFSSTDQDVIAVAVIDEFTNQPSRRRGNVPMKILFAIDGGQF